MKRILTLSEMEHIELMPESEEAEILQNINTIAQIPVGSAPMCRESGMNADALHRRESTAAVLAIRDLSVAIQDQETRAELTRAEPESINGKMTITAEVSIHG